MYIKSKMVYSFVFYDYKLHKKKTDFYVFYGSLEMPYFVVSFWEILNNNSLWY